MTTVFSQLEIIKMFDSCQRGNVGFISNEVEKFTKLRDIEGNSFLDVAIACKNMGTIKHLLQLGFMESVDDIVGAFKNAVDTGDIEIIKVLKEHYDGLSERMTDFSSQILMFSLSWASKLGHLDMVQHLLPDCTKEDINAALLEAALAGRLDILRVLLEAGADAHLDPTGGFMAQVAGRRLKDPDCPTLVALVDAGGLIDLNESSAMHFGMFGSLPLLQRVFARHPPSEATVVDLLHFAIMRNGLAVVKFLIEVAEERGYDPIPGVRAGLGFIAMTRPQPGVVDFVLDKFAIDVGGFDLDVAARTSSVALVQAALGKRKRRRMLAEDMSEAHDPAVLRLMLRDPKAEVWDDGFGLGCKYPVLMGACQKLNLESVQLLLAAGADPSEKGEEGMPLTYAVSARCPPERVGDKIAVLNALLDAGANTDELLTFLFFLCRPSNDGPPPESYRVETLLASLLARLPELPQARDPDDGATGLLVLARDHPGETRLMEMLIEAGADVRATDHGGMSVAVNLLQGSAGRTARQIQRARQSLQLLFKAGVDPAECDDDGTTLLMAAVQARYHKDSYELCETGDRAGCMYIVDVVDAVMAGSR